MKKNNFLSIQMTTLWFLHSYHSSLPNLALDLIVYLWRLHPAVTTLPVTSLLGFLRPSPRMMLACSLTSRCHGSAQSWSKVYGNA